MSYTPKSTAKKPVNTRQPTIKPATKPPINSNTQQPATKLSQANKLTSDQLRSLADRLVENPDSIHDLDEDQVNQMRKELNPLGNVISNKKMYVNMGLVNWREKYLRRLLVTSLIGYQYRTLEEYEPEAELAKADANFERKIKDVSDQETLAALKSQHTEHKKLITATSRDIARAFLNRNFEFNPDRHLRGAHVEKTGIEAEDAAKLRERCQHASGADATRVNKVLESKPEAVRDYLSAHLLSNYQSTLAAADAVRSIIGVLNAEMSAEDAQGILLKKYADIVDASTTMAKSLADMKKLAEPVALSEVEQAVNVNPPAEAFHQFDRYLTNHYEQLRDCTSALYSEKPDLEYAVILYDVHKTAEEAANYRVQHREEFRTEVFAVENGVVNLIGPFKENRERVEYYNKNTEVLRLMHSQLESDHKLGKDFMDKTVKREKKKNIEEAGPDSPALAAYSKNINMVQELGGKKMLTREEQEAMAKAKADAAAIKQDYEVPDNAIQIDVFYPKTDDDGNTTLARTEMFTEAEAPVFLEEGSPYAEKYLPKREAGQTLESSRI